MKHSNDEDGPNIRCQTSMRFGGRYGYTEEDCRKMLKMALLGSDISEDDLHGRREHMVLRKADGLVCLETEAQLDDLGALFES